MRDNSTPSLFIPSEGASITITIPATDAVLTDQGYTYNQAGFTYNQAGVTYGGVTNATQDLSAVPHIAGYIDMYTSAPTSNTNHSIGPGFFMFITIP